MVDALIPEILPSAASRDLGDFGTLAIQSATLLETSDCDDNGAGYVDFTTGLDPLGTQAAFLADKSCSRDSEENSDDFAVVCTSNGVEVHIFFEQDVGDARTSGELYLA